MITAIWRVIRADHDGQPLQPIDHTSRDDAKALIGQLERSGASGHLQQYDPFTGEYGNVE